MNIFKINFFNPNFLGQRQDRKSVEQLKQDNNYDLNVINQRRISTAIDNLAKVSGEDNINFLLDVAENLKYGTNIDLGKHSFNDWRVKLNNAAESSLRLSDKTIQERMKEKIAKSFSKKTPLTDEEKAILNYRKDILDKIDYKQLEKINNSNIKNIRRNLDYFVISSEVPTSQKLYILKRLDYFMSPEYKINPQLEDKKTQALAEIINDIVVDTPESKIPNIKAINQRSHGICAAISIARKSLAYEDKANYVDMLMSELDDSNYMQVYDITKLGTNKKIPIEKNYVDFNYALERGYRIVDSAAMYWMNVADTIGGTNEIIGSYSPFDKENFDTFQDVHITADLDGLSDKHDYYRALLKAKSVLNDAKKNLIQKSEQTRHRKVGSQNYENLLADYKEHIKTLLLKISPDIPLNEINTLATDITRLQVPDSDKAKEIGDYKRGFVYLPNEEETAKLEKLKAFLSISLPASKTQERIAENAPKILDLVSEIHSLSSHSQSGPIATIKNAKRLYKAAAAYRTQQVFQLDVPEYLYDIGRNFELQDDGTRMIENMDMLIAKLKKGSINPELRRQLAINFNTPNNNESLIEALTENKNTVNYILTDLMDDLYASCLSVSRKNVLINELEIIKDTLLDNKNISKESLKDFATLLNLDEKAGLPLMFATLENYLENLKSADCTEEDYISIYNATGHKSPMIDFKETFERLGQVIFAEPNEDVIKGFNSLHGLAPDAPIEQTLDVYQQIANNFNNISHLLGGYQSALEIKDSNNNTLNTTSPKEIILKKLENMGEILSKEELETLRQRFIKIDKIQAGNEFGSVKYKDLPSELLTLTPYEKNILKKVEKNINGWYSTVTRSLNKQYRELKEPLGELNRQIGLKNGNRWVMFENQSGLSAAQQVKIIQHMTGRPYYIEYDTKYALDSIKKSPYSGISSTSVMLDEPGMHAQYIVDVKPVTVKSGDKTEVKDVMFHDNSWGAAEHENNWIDENGFLRTDYSNNYGGKLGYITDEKYRNGNLVNNIMGVYGEFQPKPISNRILKRLEKDNERYKFPMFKDVIMPGIYPNARSHVKSLRQELLTSSLLFFEDMENYANKMSRDELKSVMKKAQTSGSISLKVYEDIMKKINGVGLNEGIVTQEDLDKFNNKEIKMLLDKIALLKSYPQFADVNQIYKTKTPNNLKQLQAKIREDARQNFNYTFAKNIDIVNFGTEQSRNEIVNILNTFAAENNIKINKKQILAIVNSMKHIKKSEFDGSLNKTIDLMSSKFADSLNKYVPEITNKDAKIKDLANSITNILQTNMGFTLADLNDSSFKTKNLENIEKWIDDTFNPVTDEEFVQIFNKLRNMTTAEFNTLYADKITDEAMGIKQISVLDILKSLRGEDDKAQDSLFNMIYMQESSKSSSITEMEPSYDYERFERKLSGHVYKKRSFEDIYTDYYYTLLTMNMGKRFNTVRQQSFEKYNAFPSFPKIDGVDKEELEDTLQTLLVDINSTMESIAAYKIQIKSFEIISDLQKRLSQLDDKSKLSKYQYSIITRELREFLNINDGDETIKELLDSVQSILDSKSQKTLDYKELTQKMYDELSPYSHTADGKPLESLVKSSLEYINSQKKEFIRSLIEPQYQQKAFELLNKWISVKSKAMASNLTDDSQACTNANNLLVQFKELFDKHCILNEPIKVLDEYLLMIAKDAKPFDLEATGDAAIRTVKEFERLKETYEINLKGLLYNANMLSIQEILMRCAKTGNINIVKDDLSKSTLHLKNGTTVPLDSDIGIRTMLSKLLVNEDLFTAILFIEQLGLSERVMEVVTQDLTFKNAYKNIKRVYTILDSVSKQSKIIQQELAKLENLDTDPDYMQKIYTAKNNIINRTKNTNYRITAKLFDDAFKNAIQTIEEHPDLSKVGILLSNLNTATNAAIYIGKQHINEINNELKQLESVHQLVKALNLPMNSPTEELRQKYLEEFDKIEKYKDNFSHSYKDIGLTTG